MIISVEGLAIPNEPAGPSIRMVMQLWTAKASEVTRVPAIRELTGYSLYSYATMNPIGILDMMSKQLPGFASAFEPLTKEMHRGTIILRIHIDLFIPAMAAMLQKMAPGGNATGAGLDERAPFLELNQDLVELSTTPVPDSAFQIPEGYKVASPSELVQAVLAKGKPAVQQ